VLAGQYLTTYQGTGGTGCGSSGQAVMGTQQTYSLSTKVLTYLGPNPTVAQLYALANAALGGTYAPANSSQPSLSEINNAVDRINNAFDNCRILGGFSNATIATTAGRFEDEVQQYDEAGIYRKAYPNPFASVTSIEFMMEKYEPSVTVEVFDMAGHKVAALFNGEVNAGVKMNVEFNALDLPAGIYVYRIIAGDSMINDKLMLVK
jgi:hypothetical protein